MSDNVSIVGLDKALVLAALYNGAKPQGAGFIHYNPEPMGREEAAELLQGQSYFDYLKGRVMKVDLSGDEIDPWGYDRDNGQGAVAEIVNALRRTNNDTNPEEAEIRHKENTRNAAILVEEHVDDKTFTTRNRDGIPTVGLGLSDLAHLIKSQIKKVLDE